MTRTLAAIVAAGLVAIGAGCGGSASTSGSATGSVAGTTATIGTTTATTVGTTTTAEQSAACTTLRTMSMQASANVQKSISSLAGVRSLSQFKQRMNALQRQLKQSARQIRSTSTPAGPLTRDKNQIASALVGISNRIGSARRAAANGNVTAAAQKLSSMPQLKTLRRADADLAHRCANT